MNKELSANTTLSHYRIVSKIGAGGMGDPPFASARPTRYRMVVLTSLHYDAISRVEGTRWCVAR